MQMLHKIKCGAKMIVIDPKKADIHVQTSIRYNIPFLNEMINHTKKEDLCDKEFVNNHIRGFEYVKKAVKGFTPQRVEEEKDPLSGMNPLKMTIANIKHISEKELLEIRNKTDMQMHPSEICRTVRR